jgi:predicted PurR-regulated permease PerM
VLGALGLLIAGVPYVAVLAALMFICCIVQIGPTLVLLGGVGWLWYTGDHGWAIALGVWTILVASLDNILRPVLIKRGADLPFLLILAGVSAAAHAGHRRPVRRPGRAAITYSLLQAGREASRRREEA